MPLRILALILFVALLPWPAPTPAWAAQPPAITARGAIVLDYQRGDILYEKNSNTPRPVASMTKVMTSYIILDAIDAGTLTMDTIIPISYRAHRVSQNTVVSGGVVLRQDHHYTAQELLRVFLVASASGAGLALVEYISGNEQSFVPLMNNKSKALGIDATYYDSLGLVDNRVTPKAMAILTAQLIKDHPVVLDYTRLHGVTFDGAYYRSTNRLYRDYPYPAADGFKTGTTSAAGFCFTGTAQRDGERVISVVLASASGGERFSETRNLLDYGFARLAAKQASPASASPDYTTSAWAEETIAAAIAKGYTCQNEIGHDQFAGREPLTRAEFAALLVKLIGPVQAAGETSFDDVDPTSWYASYIAQATTQGFLNGTAPTTFGPDQLITREQLAAMTVKAFDLPISDHPYGYPDHNAITADMQGAVNTVSAYSLMRGGEGGYFRPHDHVTREVATTVIMRLDGMIEAGLINRPQSPLG